MSEENSDLFAELERLAELRKKGTLTEEEFQSLKSQILKRLSEDISNANKVKQMPRTGELQSSSNSQLVNNNISSFLTYENPNYGFRIQYPKDWEGTELNYIVGNGFTRIAEFGLPFEQPSKHSGQYRHLLAIDFMDYQIKNVPLDIIIRKTIFLLKRKYDRVKITESLPIILSGNNAHMIVLTYDYSSVTIHAMFVLTVNNGRLFKLVYVALINEFLNGLPIIQKIFSSFQTIKSAPLQPSGDQSEDSAYCPYESPAMAIKIRYPFDWIVDQTRYEESISQIEIFSPSESDPEKYENRLIIEAKNLPSNEIVLDDFVHAYINELAKKIPRFLKFTLLESIPISVANTSAKKIVYKTVSTTGEEIRTMEILAIKDNKIYIITFAAESSKFLDYLPTIQKMIKSFRIEATSLSKFEMYENLTLGIRIHYPTYWKVDEKHYDVSNDRLTKVIGFLSSFGEYMFFEILSIHIRIPSQDMSLDEYTDGYLDRLEKRDSTSLGVTILESTSTILAKGNAAHKIFYKFRSGNDKFQSMEVWTIKNGRAYHITYTNYQNEFKVYLSIAQKTIETFEIFTPDPAPTIKDDGYSLSTVDKQKSN